MKGYSGNVLRVNLTTGAISVEHPGESFYRKFLGGRGFTAYYLMKETKPGLGVYSPDNPLIFSGGPVSGLPIAGSSRGAVGGKSPLSESFGEAEAGGFFPAEMKRAGFDIVIITGKADRPVYLFLKDGEAEIRDASHVWGKEIAETQDAIRAELGDQRIRGAYIGEAGEKLVRFAAIINDCKHAYGRGGMGALMGSKNLKAVVARGNATPEQANPDKVRDIGKWMTDNLNLVAGMSKYGTGANLETTTKTGNLPTRNCRDGFFEGAKAISADTIVDTIGKGMEGCWACAIRCKKVVDLETEYGKIDGAYGGPEYETIGMVGSNCGVDDPKAVCKTHDLCNRHGLDTISTGATVAFAMECYEKGYITKEDTGGLDLSFGNGHAVVKLTEMIAKREGIGDLLAEGTLRAARKIGHGSEEFAMQVKGQEIPAHEARLMQGRGLMYAINPSGADHCVTIIDPQYTTQAGVDKVKNLGEFPPMPATELSPKKVSMVYNVGLTRHINNCTVLCGFVPYGLDRTVELINAATGWDMTLHELVTISDRNLTLAKLYNAREGFTAADDKLPARHHTSQRGGAIEGVIVDPEKLAAAKKLYYQMSGWDAETGTPTAFKLLQLGLEEFGEGIAK